MPKHKSPFVRRDSRWFLNPIWEMRPTARLLRETLDDLLERHRPGELLLLRPMADAEVRLMEEYRADCEAELLSRMVAGDEKRREMRKAKPRSS